MIFSRLFDIPSKGADVVADLLRAAVTPNAKLLCFTQRTHCTKNWSEKSSTHLVNWGQPE